MSFIFLKKMIHLVVLSQLLNISIYSFCLSRVSSYIS
uniref:Uncharacterized protein n=1 Tax=Rhizophora mucronata TaxID=61149 RepID=A0A2P2LZV7_RHIMU